MTTMTAPDEIAGLKLHPKFQWLPPMLEGDFGRLKQSIAEHGFLADQAVVLDEDGHILDGHHRARACAELGIACPTRRITGLSDAEKEDYVWSVNLNRRHIPLADRLKLVRHRLQVRPEASNAAIARDLHLDRHTVAKVRDDAEKRGEITTFEAVGGRGKTTGEEVDWRSWERCDVCERPADPRKLYDADDGRRGHRRCLEPGVGDDLPDHRGLCRAYVSIEYPVPDEESIHNRKGLPYPRESAPREWESGPLQLSLGAPRTRDDAARLLVELQGALAARIIERPFVTMAG